MTELRREWTTQELRQAIEWRRSGVKQTVIAARLNRRVSSVNRRLRRAGFRAIRSGGPRLKDVERRFRELAARGLTAPAIARKLRTDASTARRWAGKLGLTLTPVDKRENVRRANLVRRRLFLTGELISRTGDLYRSQAAALGWPETSCAGSARILQALLVNPPGLTAPKLARSAGYRGANSIHHRLKRLELLGHVECSQGAAKRRWRAVWRLSAWLRARKQEAA